ncbi:hypothetical protein L1887_22652 [Cichorium endivia]|nr:hypothetical protein L1887_22652 [Cichorium endivia]
MWYLTHKMVPGVLQSQFSGLPFLISVSGVVSLFHQMQCLELLKGLIRCEFCGVTFFEVGPPIRARDWHWMLRTVKKDNDYEQMEQTIKVDEAVSGEWRCRRRDRSGR